MWSTIAMIVSVSVIGIAYNYESAHEGLVMKEDYRAQGDER